MRRLSVIVGVGAVALALALPTPAVAVPAPVAVTGTVTPTSLVGAGRVTFTYTVVVSGSPATSVVLTTAQDPLLPADIASVRLDGAAAPAGTLTASAPDFTLRAGTGADASSGGTLSVGSHTLTFTATSTTTTPTQTSSTLTVTSDQGTVTSAPVAVPLAQPDFSLSIPTGSGEDKPAPLGTGDVIYFDAEFRNLGGPSAGTITVTLPTGLQLGPDGVVAYADETAFEEDNGTPIPCSGDHGTVTCMLGVVPTTTRPAIIEVELQATSAGRPGTSASFSVAATPATGTDLNPADNSVSATIDFTGIADLSYTISPAKSKVTVGHKATLTLTVTNHGPQPAPMALALSLLDGTHHFVITGFDGATAPPGVTGLARIAALRSAHRNLTFAAATLPHGIGGGSSGSASGSSGPGLAPDGVLWFIGTMAPNTTVTSHLVLQAKAVGPARLLLIAASRAGNPSCTEQDCRPALATLTAVAAPKASPASQGQTPIANTGGPDLELTLLGLALLLSGGATLLAARRRRPARAA